MYALIKNTMFIGFFSSMENMKIVVNALIQSNYEKEGYHGWYHFRYAKVNANEPWIAKDGSDDANMDEGRSLLSLNTIHPEYFKHIIVNDPSTGEVINWDADKE